MVFLILVFSVMSLSPPSNQLENKLRPLEV